MKERYIKNSWQKGDIITSEKLNNIEEGIKANENALINKADQWHKHNYDDLNNKPTIPTKTSELTNDNKFASEHYVLNKIAEASLGGGDTEIDLSGYATKDDLLLKADKAHTHSQYLTEHQDISHLSTKEYVDNAINEIELLEGPQGPKGDTGPQGPKGDTGPAGTTNYNDLLNKPTIPTKTSQLTNDSNFVTTSTLDTRMNSKSIWCGTQGEYDTISVKDDNTLYFILGE